MKPRHPPNTLSAGTRGLTIQTGLRRRGADSLWLTNVGTSLDTFDRLDPPGADGLGTVQPFLVVPPAPGRAHAVNGVPLPRGIAGTPPGTGAAGIGARTYFAVHEQIHRIQHFLDSRRRLILAHSNEFAGQGLFTLYINAFGGGTAPAAHWALQTHVEASSAICGRLSLLHAGYPFPHVELADAIAISQMKEHELFVKGLWFVYGPKRPAQLDLELVHAPEFSYQGEQGAAAGPAHALGDATELLQVLIETTLMDHLRNQVNIPRDGSLRWDAAAAGRLKFTEPRARSIVSAMASAKARRILAQPSPIDEIQVPDAIRGLSENAIVDRIALEGGATGEIAVDQLCRRLPRLPLFGRALGEAMSFDANAALGLAADYLQRADTLRDDIVNVVQGAVAAEIERTRCLAPASVMLDAFGQGFRVVHQVLVDRQNQCEQELAHQEEELNAHPKPSLLGRFAAYRHYVLVIRQKALARVDLEIVRHSVRVADDLVQVCQRALETIQLAQATYDAAADDRERQLQELESNGLPTTLDLEIFARASLEPRADLVAARVLDRLIAECRRQSIDRVLPELDALIAAELNDELTAGPLTLSTMWAVLSDEMRQSVMQRMWHLPQPRVRVRNDAVNIVHLAYFLADASNQAVAAEFKGHIDATTAPNPVTMTVTEPALPDELLVVRVFRNIGTRDLEGFDDWLAAQERILATTPPQHLFVHPLAYALPFPHDLEDRHVQWLNGVWKAIDAGVTATRATFYEKAAEAWKRNTKIVVSHLDGLEAGLTDAVHDGWVIQ